MYQISSHNCGYFRFLTFRAWFSTAAAEREFRTLTVACLFVCFLSVLAASTDTRTEHTRTRSINVSFLIFFFLYVGFLRLFVFGSAIIPVFFCFSFLISLFSVSCFFSDFWIFFFQLSNFVPVRFVLFRVSDRLIYRALVEGTMEVVACRAFFPGAAAVVSVELRASLHDAPVRVVCSSRIEFVWLLILLRMRIYFSGVWRQI